jgi:hypothetical protein
MHFSMSSTLSSNFKCLIPFFVVTNCKRSCLKNQGQIHSYSESFRKMKSVIFWDITPCFFFFSFLLAES